MEKGMSGFGANLSPYPHPLLLLSLATDVISLISLPCTLEGSGRRRSPAQASQHLLTWPAALASGCLGTEESLHTEKGTRVITGGVPGCGEKMEKENLLEWELEKEVRACAGS